MSKALELADALRKSHLASVRVDAAAELRRLDAENKTLRDALEDLYNVSLNFSNELSFEHYSMTAARAALGETK